LLVSDLESLGCYSSAWNRGWFLLWHVVEYYHHERQKAMAMTREGCLSGADGAGGLKTSAAVLNLVGSAFTGLMMRPST